MISSNNIAGGGVDYDSGPYTVTFPAGQTSVSFNVSINDDRIFETNESLSLAIIQPSLPTGVSRRNPGQITVIILDNDGELYNELVFLHHTYSTALMQCHLRRVQAIKKLAN